jgi:hypothetical protein
MVGTRDGRRSLDHLRKRHRGAGNRRQRRGQGAEDGTPGEGQPFETPRPGRPGGHHALAAAGTRFGARQGKSSPVDSVTRLEDILIGRPSAGSGCGRGGTGARRTAARRTPEPRSGGFAEKIHPPPGETMPVYGVIPATYEGRECRNGQAIFRTQTNEQRFKN